MDVNDFGDVLLSQYTVGRGIYYILDRITQVFYCDFYSLLMCWFC